VDTSSREKPGVGFYIRKSALDKLTDPDVTLVDHVTGVATERGRHGSR
jgi:hypothetical protein